jgi:hypothetical protein
MKMSALDGLRGYAQDHYGVVRQENRTEYVGEERARGVNVLREPGWNKGSSPLSSPFIERKERPPRQWPPEGQRSVNHQKCGSSFSSFMGASPQTPGLAALDYHCGRSNTSQLLKFG